jgi:lipoprotein-releasing system ATP-binding protein
VVPNDTGQNLHKYYDQLHVLKVDLHIQNCLHRCLRAGKTTLLQILGTLDKPTVESGIELRINNEDILTMNDKTLSKFRNLNLGLYFKSVAP